MGDVDGGLGVSMDFWYGKEFYHDCVYIVMQVIAGWEVVVVWWLMCTPSKCQSAQAIIQDTEVIDSSIISANFLILANHQSTGSRS